MTRAINLLVFNFVSVGANSRVSKVCPGRRPNQRELRSLPCRQEREEDTSTAVRSDESVGASTRLKDSPERHVLFFSFFFTYIIYFGLISPVLVRSTWPLW